MQFDLVNIMGLGVLAYAAILLYRHYRGGAAGEEDDVAVGQRQDVLRAIKSMRNDRKS
jgi:hypothetical protein